MKKTSLGVLYLVGLLALVPRASAEDIFFGAKFGFSVDNSKFENLPFETTGDLKKVYGLRLGAQKEQWGLEVNYFYSARSVAMMPEAPPDLDVEKLKWSVLSANLLYYIVWGTTLQPYITGGYGSYRVNLVGYGKDVSGGFNLGAGLDLLLLKHLVFSAEAKYHWVKFTLNDERLDSSVWTTNLGLNIRF